MRIKLTKRILRTLHTSGIALLSAAAGTMIAAVLSLPADYVLSRTLQKSYLTSCLARIDEKRLSSPDLSSLSLCPGTGYLVFRPSDGSEPKTAGNPEAHGPISVSRETSGGTAELFSASGGPDLIQVTMFSSGSAPFWGLAATLSLIIFLAALAAERRRERREREERERRIEEKDLENPALAVQRLFSQKKFSDTLLNYTRQPVICLDSSFRILTVNNATIMLTGMLEPELTGEYWYSVFAEEEYREGARQKLETEANPELSAIPMKLLDGSTIYLNWDIVPFYDGINVKYHLAFGQDITEIKESEKALEKANRELESRIEKRTSRLKYANEELTLALSELKKTQKHLIRSETLASLGSLVAGIAHEINTPLGISVTAGSIIQENVRKLEDIAKGSSVSRQSFQNIVKSLSDATELLTVNQRRSASLVSNFKQLAVDQSSQKRYRFSAASNIEQVLTSLSSPIKQSGLTVHVSCPQDLMIDSYPGAFSQIYTNLIMNTVNHAYDGYTPESRDAFLSLRLRENGRKLLIDYIDNGKGIDPEILPKIFEPFVTTTRDRGGSGLGTNIIYSIVVQLLNGRIICENADTGGAHFVISLPLENRPDGPGTDGTKGSASGGGTDRVSPDVRSDTAAGERTPVS